MNTVSSTKNVQFGKSKSIITVLFDSKNHKELRIIFDKNQIRKDHKTAFPFKVEVFDGCTEFGIGTRVYTLTKGDLISQDPHVVHNLLAKEKSIVRLSLHKNNTTSGV
ncbi:hypothetical protein KH5_08110 [Urechidicola sp. KH5]